MKEHQTIFSIKELKSRIKSAFANGIPKQDEKIKFIENWQENIISGKVTQAKEEELKPLFLTLIFGDVLGYEFNNANEWNLRLENKSSYDSSKADAALGFFKIKDKQEIEKDVRVVIEIKNARTTLDKPQNRPDFKGSPIEQCFMYAAKAGEKCKWVIVSNFLEIRLYLANDMTKYESFDILSLNEPYEFAKFYYLLAKGQLFYPNLASTIDNFLALRQEKEKTITKEFYEKYQYLREVFLQHLKLHNPEKNALDLLQYAQTIIDRIIFVSVIKDYDLIQSNVLKKIEALSDESWADTKMELWEQLKKLFRAIDKGLPPRIHKLNGGLFRQNEKISDLIIKDVFLKQLLTLGNYDFESDLNVNILGHIFEQSITDIENLKKDIAENKPFEYSETDDEITYKSNLLETNKRKKQGIYYTPEKITYYIVANAIGSWLEEQKEKIGINELNDFPNDAQERDKHIALWEQYTLALKSVKILDPACGSGAFLTQAYDFLLQEWLIVLDIIEKLKTKTEKLKINNKIGLFASVTKNYDTNLSKIKKEIVNNNLFGVDLNHESVEITKLGLWLKSASKNDALALLDTNIKCGDSLISDKTVSEKAFDWKEGFSRLFYPEKYYVETEIQKNEEIIAVNEEIQEWEFLKKTREVRSEKANEKITNKLHLIHDLEYELKVLHEWKKTNPQPIDGFDIIIGNPPYVSANNMDFDIRQYFNGTSEYKTLQGKWDLFIPFIEKAFQLLKPDGIFSYIIPYAFLNQTFASNIRKFILENTALLKITDLHNSKIFADATVPTCIPLIKKAEPKENAKVEIYIDVENEFVLSHHTDIQFFKESDSYMFRTERLDEIGHILRNMKENSVDLGELFYVSTGAEIHGKEQRTEAGELISGYSKFDVLHTKLEYDFKPYIEGADIPKSREIGRYSYPQINLYLDYDNNVGRMRSPKFKELFESEKIIIRRSSGLVYILAILDDRKIYTSEKCILIISKNNLPENHSKSNDTKRISLKVLLGIINSSLMNLYYGSVFGGFIDVYPNYLKSLPIPATISDDLQAAIEKNVDLILASHKNFSTQHQTFMKVLESQFKIQKATEKIHDWYNLAFADFVAEIKKSKGKITSKQEFEWVTIFDEQKQNANLLMSKIKQTDKQIDELVFQVYAISSEEIKLIDINQNAKKQQ